MGNAVPFAELVHQALAFDAELRLQRPRRIVNPGMNDAAVVRARVETGPGVPLEETDGLPGGGELRRAREAHDPGAYDDGVDL